MLVDIGSRDARMVAVIQEIRDLLLEMAGVSQAKGWECVLVQGSGTMVVESVVNTVVPGRCAGGRLLVASNGAYGLRMAKMAEMYGIDVDVVQYDETHRVVASDISAALKKKRYTHVGCIHHETTAGTLNPIEEIGAAIRTTNPEVEFFVDSMSGFGCYDLDLERSNVSYLVSSANKNIEGVPGFAFALCRRTALERGIHARSLSLDLLAQWKGLEANGQFRFTPPCHALLAFRQALAEHAAEGGVPGRRARYEANFDALKAGMAQMGFHPYLDEEAQGCIITTFLWPDDAAFDFPRFYRELSERGLVIYPGKLTKANCFRLGTIGRVFPHDYQTLLLAIKEVLTSMGVKLPVRQVSTETTASVTRSIPKDLE
jgi:2-aminoethylphosphonate-pyruvate transaminase